MRAGAAAMAARPHRSRAHECGRVRSSLEPVRVRGIRPERVLGTRVCGLEVTNAHFADEPEAHLATVRTSQTLLCEVQDFLLGGRRPRNA